MSEFHGINVDRRDRVLHIEIARPDVRNAVDYRTACEIADVLDEFESASQLTVGIVSGAQGYFCAGMDLRAFGRGEPLPKHEDRGFAGIVAKPPTKPLIAAVEGGAMGGGFEIVLACDLVVAASDAVFALPEVRRGLIASAGGLLRLPRRIPHNLAMEILLTGDAVDATSLNTYGLVNRLTEPGAANSEAFELARRISGNGPMAVAASKAVVTASQDWARDEEFERQEAYADPIRRSADAKEGAAAFLEKRAPRFTAQ
jgi:enoyl-CoA hydratase